MQPLPEKVTAIEALEPSKDINELRHFLGLVSLYRKLIPFFADVMVCLNTMLRKEAVFTWTEQCNNAFKLLKSELVKMPRLWYHNPNKPFMLSSDASKHSYSGILHLEETPNQPGAEVNLIPIAYFQALLVGPNNCGTLLQKVFCGLPVHSKICILLTSYKMYAALLKNH